MIHKHDNHDENLGAGTSALLEVDDGRLDHRRELGVISLLGLQWMMKLVGRSKRGTNETLVAFLAGAFLAGDDLGDVAILLQKNRRELSDEKIKVSKHFTRRLIFAKISET